MIIITGSKIGKNDIQQSLGKPEYSYYFLLKEFLPAFEAIGTVIIAEDTDAIDQIYHEHHAKGEQVVFLSVTPPHQTPVDLECPTICVFAWEFDSIPMTPWENDPRNDWRFVFSRIQGAITTSRETCTLITDVMQGAIPVMSLPTPIWEKYGSDEILQGHLPHLAPRVLTYSGTVIDSPELGLSADGLVSPPQADDDNRPSAPTPGSNAQRSKLLDIWQTARKLYDDWRQEFTLPAYTELPVAQALTNMQAGETGLVLEGVVYTTVLNPADGRKNWIDIVTAFCWAFKNTEDATLLVKMTHHDLETYKTVLMTLLSRLSPFKCRVVVLHAYLSEAQYKQLVDLSTYYINASFCEGLCIPLLEFLSSGKPAIAPRHTAMADYINESCAVLLEHTLEPTCFPHDPTGMLHTHRHRINWASMEAAYRKSYAIAKTSPDTYREMSANAASTMKHYSAAATVSEKLLTFLQGTQREQAVAKRQGVAG